MRTGEKAAALTFHLLVALMPVAVLLVVVASSIIGIEQTEAGVILAVADTIGPDAAQFMGRLVDRLVSFEGGAFASTFMLAVILFSSIGFFDRLQSTLSALFHVAFREPKGVWGILVDYASSFVYFLVLCIGLLSFFGAQVWLTLPLRAAEALPSAYALFSSKVLSAIVALLVCTVFYMLVYRVFARNSYPWAALVKGAAVGSLLFLIVNSLFSVILNQSVTVSLYGVAGSLLAFALWMYYVIQTLLIGAIVAHESRPQG